MQIYEEKSAEFLKFVREMRGFESKEWWIGKIIVMITLRGDYRNYRFR